MLRLIDYSWLLGLILVCCMSRAIAVPQPMVALEDTARLASIERGAAEWTNLFVSAHFQPPKGSRYVFLPRSNNEGWDILRMRYTVDGLPVTITQSICLFAAQIDYVSGTDKPTPKISVDEVQRLARSIFARSDNMTVVSIINNDQEMKGNVKFDAGAIDVAPWLKGLLWQKKGNAIIFYMIKTDGKPSALDKGMDDDTNAVWFSESDRN